MNADVKHRHNNTHVGLPGEPGGCVIKPNRATPGLFPGWGPKLFVGLLGVAAFAFGADRAALAQDNNSSPATRVMPAVILRLSVPVMLGFATIELPVTRVIRLDLIERRADLVGRRRL